MFWDVFVNGQRTRVNAHASGAPATTKRGAQRHGICAVFVVRVRTLHVVLPSSGITIRHHSDHGNRVVMQHAGRQSQRQWGHHSNQTRARTLGKVSLGTVTRTARHA